MNPSSLQRANLGMPSNKAIKRTWLIVLVSVVIGIAGGTYYFLNQPEAITVSATPAKSLANAKYLGSESCAGCHQSEYKAWQSSQHAKAMQHADAKTVLGDFNDIEFTYNGMTSLFFQRDGKYYVNTDGPDGKLAEFEIGYTFGLDPIQQYLIEFPDGRLQALSIAWDSRPADKGGQRWFHLYPNEKINSADELHWTKRTQNWNYMCADCHSTDVKKNYDETSNTYKTTWKEISVGCEACHGPGSEHVKQAKAAGKEYAGGNLTAHFIERNAVVWAIDPTTANAKRSTPRTTDTEMQVCAQCHSRRGQIADGYKPGMNFHDFYRASALQPGLYHADGQQLDEVYIWASFEQSKMNKAGVICSDCHDPHTQKLKAEGNAVCAGCHLSAKYDAPSHHRHKLGSSGAQCANCHMPETTYMVIDPRRDHSLRIPRPDISVSTGAPNACNNCHRENDAAWAADAIKNWGITNPKGFQQYSGAFHAAASNQPDANVQLANVASGYQHPAIARAGALELLANYPTQMSIFAASKSLNDADPVVRRAAITALQSLPPEQKQAQLSLLLSDSVRTVRMEAANALVDAMLGATPEQMLAFNKASAEYVAAQKFIADTPEGQSSLGGFYARQGKYPDAEKHLQLAMQQEPNYIPAYINLADLYRMQGRETESELTLRNGIKIAPQAAALHHSLGLSLIRQKKIPAAIIELRASTRLEPQNTRYAYVLAVAYNSVGQSPAAFSEIRRALKQSPNDLDLLIAGATFAKQTGEVEQIRFYVQELVNRYSNDPNVRQFLQELNQ
ncbi:MAG TPA: multiheme c-type cytochrome [Arenimonas sp.]|nr:multiheme c-type cytochrome [Arenimonas sp.]